MISNRLQKVIKDNKLTLEIYFHDGEWAALLNEPNEYSDIGTSVAVSGVDKDLDKAIEKLTIKCGNEFKR